MTLRATIEIVPFGNEGSKKIIHEIDISNIGTVSELGFGNTICKYEYRVKDEDGYVTHQGEVPQHNRKHGALELVQKVLIEIGKS